MTLMVVCSNAKDTACRCGGVIAYNPDNLIKYWCFRFPIKNCMIVFQLICFWKFKLFLLNETLISDFRMTWEFFEDTEMKCRVILRSWLQKKTIQNFIKNFSCEIKTIRKKFSILHWSPWAILGNCVDSETIFNYKFYSIKGTGPSVFLLFSAKKLKKKLGHFLVQKDWKKSWVTF